MNATFNAIPSGIFNQISKITSRTEENSQIKNKLEIPRTHQCFHQNWLSSKNISKSKRNLDKSGCFKIDQRRKSGK